MSIEAEGTTRADAFRDQVAELKIPAQTPTRDRALARFGMVLALLGIVLGIVGYFMSHGTDNSLAQNDALVIAVLGVSVSVVGGAIFLRYSLSQFLRLWLLRLIQEQRDPSS
jgi:hypothetical protein